MTTLFNRVRCDRLALPWWTQLTDAEKAAVLRSIPGDHYLSITATNGSPRCSVRVFHVTPDPDVTVLVAHRRGQDVYNTAVGALRDAIGATA